MCLIIFAYKYHPKYKLVVAANRDEFYERPTLPADFWEDKPNILAGRDLKEGGTWLGVDTSGRFAALTNYRDPTNLKETAPSRGHLVSNFLGSNMKAKNYLARIPNGGTEYNGFNLLVADNESLYYYSNLERTIQEVPDGIHGLSNNLLNTSWPKVRKNTKRLAEILAKEEVDTDLLFSMMADREGVDDSLLPDTGVGLELERVLAPSFVISPNYGTTLTTLVLIDYHDNIHFHERTYNNQELGNWEQVYYNLTNANASS